jgi:hypothetical protein
LRERHLWKARRRRFLHGIENAVRPYVFEPRGGAGRLAPGDPLVFDLLLFGQAIELQAYAVLAVERMARGGLGTRRDTPGAAVDWSFRSRWLDFCPGLGQRTPGEPLKSLRADQGAASNPRVRDAVAQFSKSGWS